MRLPNLYNDHYIGVTTVSCVTDYGIRVALLCSSRWHSIWSWPVQYCVSKVCHKLWCCVNVVCTTLSIYYMYLSDLAKVSQSVNLAQFLEQ